MAFSSWFNSRTKAGEETLLLIVNLDEKYCDPVKGTGSEQTKEGARRFEKLAAKFRRTGATLCATYVADAPLAKQQVRYTEYKPAEDDILVCSTGKDVIVLDDPVLAEKLKSANIRNIMVLGTSFNKAVCNYAIAAKEKGFNVSVLTDMTGNENTLDVQEIPVRDVMDKMKKHGIVLQESSSALHSLKG